jgi:hypothetical protein
MGNANSENKESTTNDNPEQQPTEEKADKSDHEHAKTETSQDQADPSAVLDNLGSQDSNKSE